MTLSISDSMRQRLEPQLTPSQRQAVFHMEGPLLVIAGPGSGKTRVITCRIAALVDAGVQPHSICAITFTNKAAEEMRQRAFALGASAGVHISTFHSLCVRILRRYAGRAGVNPNFSIYDDADQRRCAKRAVKDCDLDAANFSPARMLEAISALKNKLIGADAFDAEADDYFSRRLAGIYRKYEEILDQNDALDFDDLLMKTALLLEGCPDVCSELSHRFRFLLIDEYQDTNHAQYRMARALVSAHNNICATGDPDQSIYRWRGADIRNILDFEQDWPDATVVKLEENFRSTPNILAAADSLIANNEDRKLKRLVATRGAGADVETRMFENEAAEAHGVARSIAEMVRKGARPSEIAVFYRVNAQSRVLEEALIRNKVPYQIVRGVEFYSRKEIRDMLAYLKILVNPADEVALLRIINTPTRGIGKTTIDRVRDYALRSGIAVYDALKRAKQINSLGAAAATRIAAFVVMVENFKSDVDGKVGPLAQRIFDETGLAESLEKAGAEGRNAIDNIAELINAASQYDQQTDEPSLIDYLQQIALFSDVDAYDPASGRVAMMTLHAAKGLEFDHVFIVGLEEGVLPHERNSEDHSETEEERRLFFVGITRARETLHLNYARYRTIRGQLLRSMPSQFLYELGTGFDTPHTGVEQMDEISSSHGFSRSFEPKRRFRPGQIVVHQKFGLGTVREFTDMGENSVVVVAFNTGQTKSLRIKYANLTTI